jgi:hypothetical protein
LSQLQGRSKRIAVKTMAMHIMLSGTKLAETDIIPSTVSAYFMEVKVTGK